MAGGRMPGCPGVVGLVVFLATLLVPTVESAAEEPELFRPGETSADVFFRSFYGGSGQGTETVKREETREVTTTVEEEIPTTRTVRTEPTEDSPFSETIEIAGPPRIERREVTTQETFTRSVEQERGIFDGISAGGGIGLNHFFDGNRSDGGLFGLGVDYSVGSGHDPIHSLNANVIVRKPIVLSRGRTRVEAAPYAMLGGGVQLGRESLATAHVGAGIEVRVASRVGVFADAGWTLHDAKQNWGTVRTGIRIAFGGRKAKPPAEILTPPSLPPTGLADPAPIATEPRDASTPTPEARRRDSPPTRATPSIPSVESPSSPSKAPSSRIDPTEFWSEIDPVKKL